MTYDKHENDKYQKKFQILKLITEAVLLCPEQEIALRGYWEQSNYTESYHEKWVNTGNVIATINAFVKLDLILKDHLKNGAKTQKMTSWKIHNNAIPCLAELIKKGLREDLSEYYAILTDEVTDEFSNKEILLLCLRYVSYQNGFSIIHETFFELLHIIVPPTGQSIGKK